MLIFPSLMVLSFNGILLLGLWNLGSKPSIGYQLSIGILIAIAVSSTVVCIIGSVAPLLPDKPASSAGDCKDLGGRMMRCVDTELNIVCYSHDGIYCLPLEER